MCKDAKSFRVVNSSFIITQPALAGGRLAGRVPAWITHRRAFLHFFLFQHLSYRVTRNYPGQKDSNVANGRQVWTALWLTFGPVPVGSSHRNTWCSWRNKPHYTAESKSYVLVTWAAACHLASVWDHGLGCDGFASAMESWSSAGWGPLDGAKTCLGHFARAAQKVVFLWASLPLSNCFVWVCHLLLHEVRQGEQPLKWLLFLNLPCAELDGLNWGLNCSICETEISAMLLHNFPGDAAMKCVIWELLFLFRYRLGWESVRSLVPDANHQKTQPGKALIEKYIRMSFFICCSVLCLCRILEVHLAQGTSPAYSKQSMHMFLAMYGMQRDAKAIVL